MYFNIKSQKSCKNGKEETRKKENGPWLRCFIVFRCLWPKGKRMISSNNMATCEKVQTFSVAGLGGATEGSISGLRRCVATSAFFSVPKRKNYLIQRSNGPLISLPETKINDSGGLLCLMLEVLRARKEPLHDQSRRHISHLF